MHIFINNEKSNCSYILVPDLDFWKSIVKRVQERVQELDDSMQLFSKIFNDILQNKDLIKIGRFQLWLIVKY